MQKERTLPLLPNYWKKIGLTLIALIVVAAICQPYLLPGYEPAGHKNVAAVFSTFSMIGLFFVAFSKDKTEDEMTIRLRLQSLSFAVVASVVTVMIDPIVTILFGDPVTKTNGFNLMMQLLIGYLFLYYIRKAFR
jgi:hypothetical protein